MVTEKLIDEILVTAEVMGSELSKAAARAFCEDLSHYGEEKVIAALRQTRREVKGKLTVSDVIARINDGRIGPQEAWAMMPKNEDATVVWTDEMALAWSVAKELIESDEVAARMSFIEVYQKEITNSRRENKPVRWWVSLGHSLHGRESPIREAIDKGRISHSAAQKFLPEPIVDAPKLTHDKAPSQVTNYLEKLQALRNEIA